MRSRRRPAIASHARVPSLAKPHSARLSANVRHMNIELPLIYDYATSGRGLASFSVPFIIGIGLFMLALAVGSFFLPTTSANVLSAVVLLPIGGWVTLLGLQMRRDRHAFFSRYVLSDTGIDITSADSSTRSVPWSNFTSAYQSRLLRYFRLESPGMSPNVVLTFGAPPKSQMTIQPKYMQTAALLHQKLGDRLLFGWL